MYKPALNSAIIFALLGVILGAMGAHTFQLSGELSHAYETAIRYQFYHSFALLFSALLYYVFPDKWIKRATTCFIIGIILFCGSIYLLIFLKSRMAAGLGVFGALTPVGGLFLIGGWVLLLIGINRGRKKRQRQQKDRKE